MSTDPVLFLLKTATRLPRPEIQRLIEGLIAFLDEIDGDPDLEEDDPSGDLLEIEGEALTDNGTPLLSVRPTYGLNQADGPINEKEALQAHIAAERGLVRSSTGGWRYPS